MHTSKIGNKAERRVAEYLEDQGFKIIELNYRRPGYEIDIIAFDPLTADYLFIEVKYRKDLSHGNPLLLINGPKHQQMQKAATSYMHSNQLGNNYMLGAASVVGVDFRLVDIIYPIF